MRIFISHSSERKPLVRDLCRKLPDQLEIWLDEVDLLAGEHLRTALRSAVHSDTAFFVVFLDSNALASDWVMQEVEWALENEADLDREFVLPVVLGDIALNAGVPAELREKKYIRCSDYSDLGISHLATQLTAQLFAWLCRRFEASPQSVSESLDILEKADDYLENIAATIRSVVRDRHAGTDLSRNELYREVQRGIESKRLVASQFDDVLNRLRNRGYLAGIVFDSDGIYVEEEHYSWKKRLARSEKRLIAKEAVQRINDHDCVIIDGGTTTYEIAKVITEGLKQHRWTSLTVISNSVPALEELLTVGSDLGLEDKSELLRLVVPSGRVRLNTFAIVEEHGANSVGPAKNVSDAVDGQGGADIAFIGTNGVHEQYGFTTHSIAERDTKRAMLNGAERCVIVSDASKIGLNQSETFARLDEEVELITCFQQGDGYGERVEDLKSKCNTRITALKISE